MSGPTPNSSGRRRGSASTVLVAPDPTILDGRVAGALWGYLIGDAIGAGSFLSQHDSDQTGLAAARGDEQPAGTWAEGGTLMLALLDSLLAVGFDPTDQAERMVEAYRDHAYIPGGWRTFDGGEQLAHAIRAFEHGVPAEQCGSSEERLSGGASIKRILALALAERNTSDAEVVDHTIRTSRIIDGTDRSQVTCALYVLIVRTLLAGEMDRARVVRDATDRLRAVLEQRAGNKPALSALRHVMGWRARHPAGSPAGSLRAAWDAFVEATSFADAIERAARHAQDRATAVGLAGGLAGAYWGLEGIPTAMLLRMRGRGIAGRLLDSLIGQSPRLTTRKAIQVDWVDLAAIAGLPDVRGRLGASSLPGLDRQRHRGVRPRDLESDATHLRDVQGVDLLLLLVLDHELEPVRAARYVETLARHGIELVRHPIPDLEIPMPRSGFQATLDVVTARLHAGESVVIACRSGRGRTALALGCLLRNAGLGGDEAIAFIQATHPGAIETPTQEAFIRDWETSAGERPADLDNPFAGLSSGPPEAGGDRRAPG